MNSSKNLTEAYFLDMNTNQIPKNNKTLSVEDFEILSDHSLSFIPLKQNKEYTNMKQPQENNKNLFTQSKISDKIIKKYSQNCPISESKAQPLQPKYENVSISTQDSSVAQESQRITMAYENDFSDFILVYEKPEHSTELSKDEWDIIIKQNSFDNFRYKDVHYSLLKGIRFSTRKDIWLVLADVQGLKEEYNINFKDLCNIKSKDSGQIQKDVLRTYVEYKECNTKDFQDSLYNILNAYAILDPELGYAQGMNFIVAALLIHLDPQINSSISNDTYIIDEQYIENSFWILVHIMKKKKFNGFFIDGMPKIFDAIDKLSKQMLKEIPHIYNHILNNQLNITTLFCQYFFTIMLYNCPKEFGKRILDLFLFQGEDMIYQVILNMCKYCEDEIMQQNDIESFMKFFRVGILQRCHEKYTQQEQTNEDLTESILNTKPEDENIYDQYIFKNHNQKITQQKDKQQQI